MVVHVVRAGESIYSIARDYGVNPAQMAAENGFSMEAPLVVGQTVVVQFPNTVHIVREGQTLTGIAEAYGVSVNTLLRNNRALSGSTALQAGELLVISYFNEPVGDFTVMGYAYPYIGAELLRSTLPFLTYLTPFTFGIDAAGHLLPPEDGWMREAAREYGTGVLLHLSTVTEEGNFSNERSSLILNDPALQDQLAQEILSTIQAEGYAGLDIDFEYVLPQEREAYAAFVTLLREKLNGAGYPVTVALAPKTYAQQPGLLYEAHDYNLLGQAANYAFLMTYEWGYTYGPPMAVAPLPSVRRVLDYALTEIPAEKLLLGVPNYGYDWPLPFVQGESRATSISNEQAVALARQYGAEIIYDETAQSPYFHYRDEAGTAHEVWFEDARSIREKLLLAAGKNLHGVGYWNLDRPFAQNWLVLNALYHIQ